MSFEYSRAAQGYSIRHVARLRGGWHETIGFGGQEQRRMMHLVQSTPDVVVSQKLESIDVTAALRARSQPDKSLDLRAIRLARVKTGRGQLPHQTHGFPRN